MKRIYKYRIYPNKTAQKRLNVILMVQRYLYNEALRNRIDAFKSGKSVSVFTQIKEFNSIRKEKYEFVNCSSVQQIIRRVDKTFRVFIKRYNEWKRTEKGDKPGFPRFKSASRFNTVEFIANDGCRLKEIESKIKLSITGLHPIRIKMHRSIPNDVKIKRYYITRRNKKWYACVCFESPIENSVEDKSNKAISICGIDLGISHLVTTSDGEFYDSPKYYIASQKKLRVLQRSVARKKRGSKSRKRAVAKLVRLHEHIANQRADYLHKLTFNLVKNHNIICVEDLNLKFMCRNKHLAKSAYDVAMGSFLKKLEYKAESAGTQVIKVDPKYTSQICSNCGKIVKKSLSVRTHRCNCGLVIDRDINAAKNILSKGFHRGASLLGDVTWAEVGPCVSPQAHRFNGG